MYLFYYYKYIQNKYLRIGVINYESPLQSGLVIFPLSVAWITLNFNLHRIEAKLSRKVIYLLSFTLLLVSSIIISFGIKLPVLIAFVLILAGLSFGYIYTKDSVIVQEETSPLQMKKMMSFYGLTKNLGASNRFNNNGISLCDTIRNLWSKLTQCVKCCCCN